MNFLEYQRIADQASDFFWLAIGGRMPSAGMRQAYVMLETHVRHLRELRQGDPVAIDTRLIAYDQRRFHLHHTLLRGEQVVCVVQLLGLAFDLDTRRAARWSAAMLEKLAAWRTDAPAAVLNGVCDWKLGSAPG